MVTVSLLERCRKQQDRLAPEFARRPDLIADDVRKVFRGLVRGELPWPLFLYGGVGCGKTSAILALSDYVKGQVFYFTASSLIAEVIAVSKGQVFWKGEPGQGDIKATPKKLERRIRWASLVILDDLATREVVKDWHYEAVKDLVDWRTNKPLIVTSNHDAANISKIYDDRLSSRITAGTVLQIVGSDRRQKR